MSGKKDEAVNFVAEEYKLSHIIATLKTPFIAILNGITSKEPKHHATFSIALKHVLYNNFDRAVVLN